jgi:uncharacterized secreted repeat protein (TIGR03808 family)
MSGLLTLDRRAALLGTAIAGASAGGALAKPKSAVADSPNVALLPAAGDQTSMLQRIIDERSAKGGPIELPPGRFAIGRLVLKPGTHIIGYATTFQATAPGPLIFGADVPRIRIEGLTVDGAHFASAMSEPLIAFTRTADLALVDLTVSNAGGHGIRLEAVSGHIHGCTMTAIRGVGLWSLDAAGLDIAHNTISDCGDNGLLVWRSKHGEDGTIVAHNRVSNISARSGGTGQNGNGINVYRAARVHVSGNIISDCAYSAVRANESSGVLVIANSAQRIGEVALYVEAADERAGAAGFEGAVIANNTVDRAACGIVVTNFNNGGRLAVVQGNLVRNLSRREHEPVDKRGEGICVEADAIVSNNVIENAPTSGLMIGWGRHMREVVATGNLIRQARIGIAVSGDTGAGPCLIANNMITQAREGAIRLMDHARAVGSDLAHTSKLPKGMTLTGNVTA